MRDFIVLTAFAIVCVWLFYAGYRFGLNEVLYNSFQKPEDIIEYEDVVIEDYYACLDDWSIMILSIASVETGGYFDPSAKNPKSTATGILQQLECIVDDCNRILGCNKYVLSDRLDPEKCIEMFEIIQQQYNPFSTIPLAIKLHSVGFSSPDQDYAKRVHNTMKNIKAYEEFRKLVVKNQLKDHDCE